MDWDWNSEPSWWTARWSWQRERVGGGVACVGNSSSKARIVVATGAPSEDLGREDEVVLVAEAVAAAGRVLVSGSCAASRSLCSSSSRTSIIYPSAVQSTTAQPVSSEHIASRSQLPAAHT